MNRLNKIALLSITSLVFSFSANAGNHKTDGQLLTECKSSITAQFDSIDSIKATNISSRRGIFKAKLRVKANGERSTMLCTLKHGQPVALTCTKGECPANTIAAK